MEVSIPLNKNEIADVLGLTPMQEGMLYHYLKEPDTDFYSSRLYLGIKGMLDIPTFETALNDIVAANEMLRVVFRWTHVSRPTQLILKTHRIKIEVYDLTGSDAAAYEKPSQIEGMRTRERQKSFDLQQVPFRVTLCKTDREKYLVIISNHHILYDGWSTGIILAELFDAYQKRLNDPLPVKPAQKTKFKEFVLWCNRQDQEKQKDFWSDYLNDADIQPLFPREYVEAGSTTRTGTIPLTLDEEIYNRLHALAREQKITPAVILYTACGLLLQLYSHRDDVVFGTTVSGRTAAIKGIEDVVGLFINTLPLRIKNQSQVTFIHFFKQINSHLAARETYEHTPLVKIKEYCGLDHQATLFDAIVVIENYPLNHRLTRGNLSLPLTIESYSMEESTGYPLTIGISGSDTFHIEVNYRQDSFKSTDPHRLAHHFVNMIHYLVKYPGNCIHETDILSDDEKQQILDRFNDSSVSYPKNRTLPGLFSREVVKNPDRIAVAFEDTQLTYRELDGQTHRLALLMKKEGVMTNTVIAVRMERSIEIIIAILGILKSGAVYLPLDPQYPENRINFMLADSQAQFILTEAPHMPIPPRIHITNLGTPTENNNPYGTPHFTLTPDTPAYTIYTSGSTGKPKGVLGFHAAVVNLVYSRQKEYCIDVDENILLFSSISFDPSLEQIFVALLHSARLVLIDKETLLSPPAFARFLSTRQITHLNAVPSFLAALEVHENTSLRRIVTSGDVCPPQLVRQLRPYGDFYNEYGPTETTIISLAWKAQDPTIQWTRLPIGTPVANTDVYIVNKNMKPVPIGVPGELFIGGDGVAYGYLNRPELTAEQFIPHFYKEGRRLYRTGDLCKWMEDGNIDFLGRRDKQIKIRGYRIETGEIEKRLLAHPQIAQAWVIPRQSPDGKYFLCAYVVPPHVLPGTSIDIPALRDYLLEELPDYMIPSFFISLQHHQIPLTPAGKIDHDKLPHPGTAVDETYIAPCNSIETKLVDIWAHVLQVDKGTIGTRSNFFHRGGHSLNAIAAVANVNSTFGLDMPLAQLFKHPTPAQLAVYIAAHIPIEINDESIHKNIAGEKIPGVEDKEYYPLSSAQKRFYILQQMDRTSTGYNMPFALQIKGELNLEKLTHVFKYLIQRHESLRTSFRMLIEEPVQQIHDQVDFAVEMMDPVPGETNDDVMSRFIHPFDLDAAPLLRVALARQDNRCLLLTDMHHIISDGISVTILIREFSHLYSGKELAPNIIQYKDYTLWQHREKTSDRFKKQAAYWKNIVDDDPPRLNLPVDFVRPAVRSFAGQTHRFYFSKDESGFLRNMARQNGATLYMVLLALCNLFLSKITGQDMITLGTPVTGRRHEELNNIIGILVNTVVLRNYPHAEKTFLQFLQEVKENALAAFDNQEYPFEDMVETAGVARDAGYNPLFDVMFTLQTLEPSVITLPGLTLTPCEFEQPVSKFDLTMTAVEENDHIQWQIEYAASLFSEKTIHRLMGYFRQMAASIKQDSQCRLADILITSEQERSQILEIFNNTTSPYPTDKTLDQLIKNQVEKTPDLVGVVFGEINVTYRELDRLARHGAAGLKARAVGPDVLVGIIADRSLDMVITLLSIIYAGGAYCPLDPSLPAERLLFIIMDSGLKFLTGQNNLQHIPANVQHLDLHFNPDNFNYKEINTQPTTTHTPDHLIYALYTSGTTGKPKGTLVNHRNVVNLLTWYANHFHLSPKTHILLLTDITFDPSVEDIFGTLISGAQLHIAPREQVLKQDYFRHYVETRRITLVDSVPDVLEELLGTGEKLTGLETVISGGERLKETLKENLLSKGYRLHNHYGPTEITVDALAEECSTANVTIGKPIHNVNSYILDPYFHLQPVGIAGELCIAGAGVARGYLNRPELTSEKFVCGQWLTAGERYPRGSFEKPPLDPAKLLLEKKGDSQKNSQYQRSQTFPRVMQDITALQTPPHAVGYKTGDLARWNHEGKIEFLGRIDLQVKIRGIRIEPGEVENRLLKYPGISGAVVAALEYPNCDKYLCAYVTSDTSLRSDEIKDYLGLHLPAFMVPAHIVMIEEIPLTRHGKVDFTALPSPRLTASPGNSIPRDALEEKLAQMWAEVLKIEKSSIGIDSDFFHLGGHSLKATVLASRIHKELNAKMSIGDLFKIVTIRQQACFIRESAGLSQDTIEAAESREFYPLSSAQHRFYMLQKLEEESLHYNMPSFMTIEGPLEENRLSYTFNRLIQRHESFRTSFLMLADGPIQVIHPQVDFEVEYYQAQGDRQANFQLIITRFIRPFRLDRPPLLRVGIARFPGTPPQTHLLMVDMHHIISDGTSVDILIKEFTALYENLELPPQLIHYKDFCMWQTRRIASGALEPQEEYWLKQFTPLPPALDMPTDYPRPTVQSFEGDRVAMKLGEPLTARVKDFLISTQTTLYMLLVAVCNILLARYSGREDIVVGSPIAGRYHADLHNIVGLLIEAIAIRNRPQLHKTFIDFLNEVKQNTLEAYENQEYPFRELIKKIANPNDLSRNPLFDVMLIVQNMENVRFELNQLELTPYTDHREHIAKVDLTITAEELPEQGDISLTFDYCTRLFKNKTMEKCAADFVSIIERVIINPELTLEEIEVVGTATRQEVLEVISNRKKELNADFGF